MKRHHLSLAVILSLILPFLFHYTFVLSQELPKDNQAPTTVQEKTASDSVLVTTTMEGALQAEQKQPSEDKAPAYSPSSPPPSRNQRTIA